MATAWCPRRWRWPTPTASRWRGSKKASRCAAPGVRAPIVLLEGVFNAEQLAEAAHHGFELVVHDPLQLKLLEAHRGAERFVVWIKMDTGMNRLGFRPEAFAPALGAAAGAARCRRSNCAS